MYIGSSTTGMPTKISTTPIVYTSKSLKSHYKLHQAIILYQQLYYLFQQTLQWSLKLPLQAVSHNRKYHNF